MSESSSPAPAAADETRGIVPREGSSLYYALLWTESAARRRFLGTLSLLQTLGRTLDEVHDPGVAERKVHWWHEEIERLSNGAPRHPRTIACRACLGGSPRAAARRLDVLSVTATERFAPPATDEEARERHERDYGARLALLAHALSAQATDLDDDGVRHAALARGFGSHAALSRLPALVHRGFAVFSDERYARHALAPAALAAVARRDVSAPRRTGPDAGADTDGGAGTADPGDDGGEPRALVAAGVDEALAAFDEALSDARYRAVYARRELAPIARLAALRRRQTRLWRDARPNLLRERLTLTPLVKLAIAWRHRRGAR